MYDYASPILFKRHAKSLAMKVNASEHCREYAAACSLSVLILELTFKIVSNCFLTHATRFWNQQLVRRTIRLSNRMCSDVVELF